MHPDETRGLLADLLSRGLAFIISALGYTPANKAGDTFSGAVVINSDLTNTGNTTLGNASVDTLNVGAGDLVKDASGNTLLGTTTQPGAARLFVSHTGSNSNALTVGDRATPANNTGLYFRTNGSATIETANAPLLFVTAGTEKARLSAAGDLGIGLTPSGTYKLEVNGSFSINSTVMLRTATSFANGAAAAAGTLLNAPAAGNPTKWIPINDNGVTRYIPAW